jgi:hypothetical protein
MKYHISFEFFTLGSLTLVLLYLVIQVSNLKPRPISSKGLVQLSVQPV